MVMEMGGKGKGELVWFSPERSSQWLTFLSHILGIRIRKSRNDIHFP